MTIYFLIYLLLFTAVFLFGLRLSAFFSGCETGFYRISRLRLSIDAQSGDAPAAKLLWFVKSPAYFVATMLIGNNVANYITTVALLSGAALIVGQNSTFVEISATLLFSPIIFIFAELMPKNLYYRAPMSLLRNDAKFITVFYYLFLPVSFPLIGLTKLLSRLGRSQNVNAGTTLSRNRLIHVVGEGEKEGVLTAIQNQLVQGMFDNMDYKVGSSMTKIHVVYSIEDSKNRDEILEFARKFGLSFAVVKSDSEADPWVGYYKISELYALHGELKNFLKPLPRFSTETSKLEVLFALREQKAVCGLVISEKEEVVGLVSQRGLSEQLFISNTRGSMNIAKPKFA